MANNRTKKEKAVIHFSWDRQGEPHAAYLNLYARIFADILSNKKAVDADGGKMKPKKKESLQGEQQPEVPDNGA